MLCNAVYAGSVRIVTAKKPEYSMLCSEENDGLTAGERLRVMRLRAGYTIEQAARAVGVGWRVIMNYELGKVKRRKQGVLDKLFGLYSSNTDAQ